MATIPLSRVDVGAGYATLVTWAGLGNADDGAPFEAAEFGDRTFQVAGTFGGATVVFEGSNDGTNYATLTDAQTSAISKTAAALETVTEVPRYVRPRTSGGTGTALTVTLYCRRTQR